jgi:hypothetical protein
LNEWLKLMLDEIRRKRRERDEALRERERRASEAARASGDETQARPTDRRTTR